MYLFHSLKRKMFFWIISHNGIVKICSNIWNYARKWRTVSQMIAVLERQDIALRKQAYSNILKILSPKNENFQIIIRIVLYFCLKHRLWYSLEPPRRGGSNEYPQSMFLSRNKNMNVYPCKPQFYYIKVGFKGSTLYRYVFMMVSIILRLVEFHS